MFLLLSGEGPTDIGVQDDQLGPMTKLVDNWIVRRSQYSLIDTKQYIIVAEQQLVKTAKSIRPLSRRGKRQRRETRYFYNNARALAILAREQSQSYDRGDVIPVLFRDADGTASSGRGEWQDKWDSMLAGFEVEQSMYGVPMIPKPKSEAWILCALRNRYQYCVGIESESGNDASPNSLKRQLEQYLGEPGTRMLLNDKIEQGEIDIALIVDMPSLTAFKDRLDEVLDNLNLPKAS